MIAVCCEDVMMAGKHAHVTIWYQQARYMLKTHDKHRSRRRKVEVGMEDRGDLVGSKPAGLCLAQGCLKLKSSFVGFGSALPDCIQLSLQLLYILQQQKVRM